MIVPFSSGGRPFAGSASAIELSGLLDNTWWHSRPFRATFPKKFGRIFHLRYLSSSRLNFRPGEFEFNRVTMPLKGKPWEVLKALAIARAGLNVKDYAVRSA